MSRTATSRRLSFDPSIRCYLFYGADEAGSRANAATIAAAVGADAERVDLTTSQLRSDPALLVDEAASSSLFGTPRYIRVDGVSDESLVAIEGLLTATATVNPVILIAGPLRKESRLVKRLDREQLAYAVASYPLDVSDLAKLAVSAGADLGLRFDSEVGIRLAHLSGGDRAVMIREIEKLADYTDASPETPRQATLPMLDAIGADLADADLGRAVDAALRGDQRGLETALAQIPDDEAVALVRAVQRRLIAMAGIRGEIDRGSPVRAAVEQAGRSLFWKDRETIGRDIGAWSSRTLARATDLAIETERALKSSVGAGAITIHRTLHTFARSVRR